MTNGNWSVSSPNSRLELYECVSISAEVIVTRNISPKKDMSGWTHSIAARTSDNALHAPRKDVTP